VSDLQPGQRPPAPGQLALVQAFLNTHFDLGERWGEEVLHSPDALGDWLSRHGLNGHAAPLRAADLESALALRRAMRSVIAHPGDEDALRDLSRSSREAPATAAFTPDGPRFAPAPQSGARGALGALAAIAAAAMLDGTWSRLKLCPGHHCGWAFYDQSRNRSGRWCSMSVCGSRTKARAHYARRRAGAREDP
jgi:predicted RNA-binding Zn ribbon-like protein